MNEANSGSANVGPGDKIAGYQLEEQVGQGGMAVVYRARDERLDRQVALKVLAPTLAADPAFRARFIRESRAAAAVDHRHILPVYDTGDAGGVLFIAMRYIAGGDVRTLFAGGQVVAPARVWNIASQVADALDAAHGRNLIHRDVKPANILIDVAARSTSGRIDHVYLTDFGVSMHGVTSHLTGTGHFVGSLAYISPEQIEAKTIQGYADQYSLACATYEMLTGEPPFAGDNAVALINAQLTIPPPAASAKRPGLAPAVDLVLAKALAKAPGQRYPTCSDFTEDLGKALGLVPGTPPVGGDTHTTAPPAGGGQPIAPTPTEVTDPALLAAGTTGPGQVRPEVGYVSVPLMPPPPPMPPPLWVPPVHVPAPPRRKDQAPLIAALVAVVVAILATAGTVAFIATRNTAQPTGSIAPVPTSIGPIPTTSPTPTTITPASQTEAAEVTAIGQLLTSSGGVRTNLSAVVSDVASCLNVADDVTELDQIVSERESQLSDAESLQVDAISNGTQLQSDLVTALMASLAADNDYLNWAQEQNDSNCADGENSQYYGDALSDDQTASTDKAVFEQLWTPLAVQYNQPQNGYF
jgi:serine/threonine-protein kinase